jgi:hypothetical protein
MSMPRFTADASLCTLDRTYQGAVSHVRSGAIIRLAVHFPFFDDPNRCGCSDGLWQCLGTCLQTDRSVDACLDICNSYLTDCYADCDHRLLTLPPSVVRPLGR